MSLYSSLYTGVSGLQTNSQELSVVGDNVANANTIGFKKSRAAFEDILGQNLATAGGEIGLGAKLSHVQKILTQGALTTTGLATDLALQGDGFFMVKGTDNVNYFTRAGQFTVDEDGYMTNLDGLRVQGFGADEQGNIAGVVSELQIGAASSLPNPTSEVVMQGNLDASAAAPINAPIDPLDPDSYNFSNSTTLYDSLGNAISATAYFASDGAGGWSYEVYTDGANVTGGTPGTATQILDGTLTYGTDGELIDHTQNTTTFDPAGATAPQTVTLNFGDPTNAGGTGLGGMTQFSNPSSVSFLNQDGFGAGELANVRIEQDGTITGAFTNGQTRPLGQVAVADFTAADQLDRIGGNLFAATATSGEPNVGVAGTGGKGTVVAGALEQSNVDLASEFVRMIVAQRGYQANSKTVTTADSLLNELIQIKR